MEDYFKHGNPEGKSRREIFGEPMRSIPALHDPVPGWWRPNRPTEPLRPGRPRSQPVLVMPWAMKSQTSSAVTGRAAVPSGSPG